MKNGLIVDSYGNKHWYKNDKYHRDDGPALEFTRGTKYWFQNGKRHRIDGPAIEWGDGSRHWYYHGKQINCFSQKEFNEFLRFIAFI